MTRSHAFRFMSLGVALAATLLGILWFRAWRVRSLIDDLQVAVKQMDDHPGGKTHDQAFSAASYAMWQLGLMRSRASPAVPVLVDILEGPDRHLGGDRSLRIEAAVTLGLIGPYSVEPLIGSLKHSDAQVRKLAAEDLGQIGRKHAGESANAIMPLSEALDDDDEMVRTFAAEALWKFGPAAKPALPALTRTLQNESDDVRYFARAAIDRITDEAPARAGVQ